MRYHHREEGPAGPSARLISCLITSPLPFGSAEALNHSRRDARWSRGGWGRSALGREPPSGGLRAGCPPARPGSLLADVMRRRGHTCAPARAAPVRLRVANGMRGGEAERKLRLRSLRNAALACPALWRPSRGAGAGRGGARRLAGMNADFQVVPGIVGGRAF